MPLFPNTRRVDSFLIYHGAATGTFAGPTAAGTVEPSNAPMARTLADLSMMTQMRLVIGQRVLGAGATSYDGRIQYSTNGATQTTFADAQATGTGLALQTGTANTLRETGWIDLASGARIDTAYLRFVTVIVGTATTAPTIARIEVQFR